MGRAEETMPGLCETCRATPLDDAGHCVTCDAEAEGLKTLTRSGWIGHSAIGMPIVLRSISA